MQLTLKYRFRNKKPMYFAVKKELCIRKRIFTPEYIFLKLLPKRTFGLLKKQNEI
jgi:hypothetical protein